MLTCITCFKQTIEDEGGGEESTNTSHSNTKQAIQTLTTQMKDTKIKVSGSYKCKPGQAETNYKNGQRSYPDFETISEGVPYPFGQYPGNSNSTPAWDFRSNGYHASRHDSRFNLFEPDHTRAGLECFSAMSGELVLDDEDVPKEWSAQVEPGVQITFVSLARGGNDLKRIRFSREMFDKWQAQRWWGENYERIMELYNVQRFNQQALNTPGRSEDGRDSTYSRHSTYSRLGSVRESPRVTPYTKEWIPKYRPFGDSTQQYNTRTSGYNAGGIRGDGSSIEASRTTTSSRDDASVSISNASDIDLEWIEEDEPGVFVTIRQLVDGTRELRRLRFSREKFGEVHAKMWWETNRDRIQSQYLCL